MSIRIHHVILPTLQLQIRNQIKGESSLHTKNSLRSIRGICIFVHHRPVDYVVKSSLKSGAYTNSSSLLQTNRRMTEVNMAKATHSYVWIIY